MIAEPPQCARLLGRWVLGLVRLVGHDSLQRHVVEFLEFLVLVIEANVAITRDPRVKS